MGEDKKMFLCLSPSRLEWRCFGDVDALQSSDVDEQVRVGNSGQVRVR